MPREERVGTRPTYYVTHPDAVVQDFGYNVLYVARTHGNHTITTSFVFLTRVLRSSNVCPFGYSTRVRRTSVAKSLASEACKCFLLGHALLCTKLWNASIPQFCLAKWLVGLALSLSGGAIAMFAGKLQTAAHSPDRLSSTLFFTRPITSSRISSVDRRAAVLPSMYN